jgi:molecular chaperone DnaJ
MDFYTVLGLERGCSLGEIKRAYRRLARRYHPDINPGDRAAAAQFQQISEAYETLSEPERRHHYDTRGSIASGAVETTYGFEGFDFSVSLSGQAASTFGDLFADIVQQRQARQGAAAQRGADLHQTISMGFEEAVRGGQRQISITRQEQCRTCGGAGRLTSLDSRCAACHGSGVVKSARGHMVFSKPCPHCGGTGRNRETICRTCGGQTVETRSEPLTIALPPGLGDGARIRVAGKGHAGRNGGERGDLYITVDVRPHPLFTREGDDVRVVVPVAIHEAALGARVEVPTLEGPARLRVPPGTQSGQRFRLHDRGIPGQNSRRGDLVVEVRLVLPKLLDERSKELLREFGRINSDDVRKEWLPPLAGPGSERTQEG